MQNRAWIVLACGLVIAAVFLLAPALGDLRFEPARQLARGAASRIPPIPFSLPIDENTSIGEIFAFWLAIALPIMLIVLLLPPELRKKALQQLLRFALFVLALVLGLRYRLIRLPELDGGALESSSGGFQTPGSPSDVDVFTPPVIPAWLTYLISFLIVGVLVWGIYRAYRVWQHTRVRRGTALDRIAVAARDSLNDLTNGRQWGDVVVEAYARMTAAVREARGMQRDAAWTPREFADRLAHKGLPIAAVDDLTRLFEAARYGGAIADEAARHRAASCLESILRACRVTA